MSTPTRSVLRLARTGIAVSLAASLLASPVPASAITRADVMKRAARWTDARIPYSQARYYQGYRTDCSGYVSMAWGLGESLTTWTIPRVAKRIGKSQLQPGDVLLNASGGADRHVVIFGGWANKAKTRYIGYEQNGPVGRAVRRVIPYPFFFSKSRFKPYRYEGLAGRPSVKTARYVENVRGSDRYTTAVRASGKAFRKGTVDTVVIASGEDQADALVASSLAGAYRGPLLLVRPDRLHGEVAAEIRRLGARNVIIVGGGNAVGPGVARALAARTRAKVSRIAGRNRYDTAAKVALKTVRRLEADPSFHYDGTVMIANANQPVDAIAATPLASRKAWPILLTHPGHLSAEADVAIGRIGVNRVVVLGSSRALSPRVAREAGEHAADVARVGKHDRYSTSVALAEFARREGLGVEKVALVTNEGPDSVAAGVSQGAQGSVVMVTKTDELSPQVGAAIAKHAEDIGKIRVIGGSIRGEIKERLARELDAAARGK